MSQTFGHKGRRVDFDLWALPDFDFVIDFDLVAQYAITGSWRFVPKEYLSEETRGAIEADISDQDKSWAGIIVGFTAVIIVNIVAGTLIGVGLYTGQAWMVTAGSTLLAFPDLLVYGIGYAIGDYFWG